MKFIVIALFLFCLSCNAQKAESNLSNKSSKESETMKNADTKTLLIFKNKTDNVEYEYKAKLLKAGKKEGEIFVEVDSIIIEYKVSNLGKKNYLLFNQGHDIGNSKTYTEPQKDGIIEISQKRFIEPKDKNCPDREYPIMPNAIWLKSKQTITQTFIVSLPLKVFTPFDDCNPKNEMPEKIKGLKFCLGIAEANAKKVKIDEKGFVKGWESVKPQKLLCSDLFNLT